MPSDINSIMTKSEFLADYYKRKPWYYIFLLLTLGCVAAAAFLLIFNGEVLVNIGKNFSSFDSVKMVKFAWCVVAGVLIILTVPCFILTKRFNSKAVDAYSKYLSGLEMKPDISEENLTAGENEWKCKACGRVNANYVGTCACKEIRPAGISPSIAKDD